MALTFLTLHCSMELLASLFRTRKPRKAKSTTPKSEATEKTPKKTPFYRKKKIPAALKQQVWLTSYGEVFKAKCKTSWCSNTINVWNFECGHNIPESKGGPTTIDNLVPICRTCNGSMGNRYSFTEWCETHNPIQTALTPSLAPVNPSPIPYEHRPVTRSMTSSWCVPSFHPRKGKSKIRPDA